MRRSIARLVAGAAQGFKLLDVDQPLGRDYIVFHQGQQVGAAGEDGSLLP